MDLVDHFVREGVFSQNRHRHFFTDGEGKSAREKWLCEVDEICKSAGTGYVVRETADENGNPGYEFGFADKAAYAAFVLNAFGDLEKPGGHIQIHSFGTEPQDYREAFFLAAESHLAALGIKHQWREQDGKLQFAFDRFSDRLMFEALIEQGTIDASAQGLVSIRAMQHRLGFTVAQSDGPRLDLE